MSVWILFLENSEKVEKEGDRKPYGFVHCTHKMFLGIMFECHS